MQTVGEKILRTMREVILGFASNDASMKQVGKISIECDLSETHDDADTRQRLNLAGEVGGAVTNLLRQWLVARWSTTHDRSNPGVAKLEAIVAVDGAGLGGQAKFMQDWIHEVTGTIASKGAASTVGSVGAGGKAENENAGSGVAEAGNGTGPVSLVQIGTAFRLADAAAVVTKAGTAFTGNDGVANLLEEWGRILCVKRCHCI